MAWDKDKPGNNEKIRELGTVIRANWLEIEQNDTAVKANALNQWVIHLLDRSTIGGANTPARIDDVGMLYCRDDGSNNELFFQDSQDPAQEIQLTSDGKIGATDVDYEANSISFDGTTTYNENNFITHWATVNAAGTVVASSGNITAALAGGVYTMTFGAAVTNANYGVVATIENVQGNPHTINYSDKTVNDFLLRQANQNATRIEQPFTVMVIGAFPA